MLINSDVRWYGVWRRSGRRAAGGEKGGTIIPLRKKKRKERKRREEKRRKERGINTKNEGDILIIGDQSVVGNSLRSEQDIDCWINIK